MERFRRIALLLLLPGLLLLSVGCEEDDGPTGTDDDAPKGTKVSGTISGSISGVYTIDDTVTVEAGDKLTIAAGTEIYFMPGAALHVEGEIQAVGTETDWITFTSVRSNPDRGDWNGIRLIGADDNSMFEYVHVLYGAKYDLRTDTTRFRYDSDTGKRAVPEFDVMRGAITIRNCSPTVRRSIIELGGYDGIHIVGNSQAVIEHNTIVQNAFNGIHVEPDWGLVDKEEGADDPLGDVYANLAQSKIHNNIIVENDDAGIRMPQDEALYINGLIPEVMYNDIWNNASLAYVPPDWVSPSTPNYADVSTNIQMDPVFEDLESSDYDLHPCSNVVDKADPSMTDADGTRSDIGALPLYQGPYDLAKRLVNDNVYNKLNLEAGEVYYVRCNAWVGEDDVLTIGPGTILAFTGPYSLYLHGGFEISGAAGNEVVFTSAYDEPGPADWRQIVIDEAPETSFMEHVIIEYASLDNRSTPSPDTLGALSILASSPRIENVTVRESFYAGVYCYNGSNPILSNIQVENVGYHGIICYLNSSPTITQTTVTGTGGYGIQCVSNSNPHIENVLLYDLGASAFFVTELSSPTINYATVYGLRSIVIGDEDPTQKRFAHSLYARNFSRPVVSNSIFAVYNASGVLSEVSSSPELRYTYVFTDNGIDPWVGNVLTESVSTDELEFVDAAGADFRLPNGSDGKTAAEDGGEVGAYGGNGM